MTAILAPAAVRQIDLDAPIYGLQLGASRSGQPYRSLLAIGRVGGRPRVFAQLEVDETSEVPRDRLAEELRRALVASGEPWPSAGSPRPVSTPGGGQPRVSVVIATCSNPHALERCLHSILRSDYRHLETIVVENTPASSTTAELLAARFAGDDRIRYVEEPRRGASRARNAGLAHARGEIVAFADDDLVVDRRWLGASVQALQSESDVACVTGLILPLELESESQVLLEQFATFGKGLRRAVYRLPDARRKDPLFPYTIGSIGSGASMVMRARAARELGGFDTTLGPGTAARGAEDLDLLVRLLRARHAVAYEPGAVVWHEHPDGMDRLRRRAYSYGVGFGALLAKQLITGPERGYLLRSVPAGLRYLRDADSRKNAAKPPGFPRHLGWLERAGMLVGPLAYGWSAAAGVMQ
jgi:GT2 family glycosyltransferase